MTYFSHKKAYRNHGVGEEMNGQGDGYCYAGC